MAAQKNPDSHYGKIRAAISDFIDITPIEDFPEGIKISQFIDLLNISEITFKYNHYVTMVVERHFKDQICVTKVKGDSRLRLFSSPEAAAVYEQKRLEASPSKWRFAPELNRYLRP